MAHKRVERKVRGLAEIEIAMMRTQGDRLRIPLALR